MSTPTDNGVNGVPSCANGAFQNGILRDQWGWDGYITSDCGALDDSDMRAYVNGLNSGHSTPEDLAAAELKAGTDMECPNLKVFSQYAASALGQHKINMSDIDRAIARKFVHFIALGELESPDEVPYQRLGPESVLLTWT